jgi:hypothetical protein
VNLHVRSRGRYLALLCGLGACGQVEPDPPPDAPPFPDGPFAAPRLLMELSDPTQEDDPTLTDDMLEIYFASTRATGQAGNADIWRSTRPGVTDPWSAPVPVDELNTTRNDENPGISGDGLTLWLSSNRDPGIGIDIYVSTRGDRGQRWSTPVRVPELSSAVDDLGAEPARSQLRIALYGDNPRRLFESTRASVAEAWTAPAPIDALNQPATENHLSGFFVSDLELWFSSTRPDGMGQHDIYRAVRPSIGEPFGTPTPAPGINSRFRDDDPWLSPDGHTLYFTSTATGNQEIYVAERP